MSCELEGKEIEGEIMRLAFGGMGVMRYEGLVVFVPFTAPGELIKAQIKRQHKKFAEAELLEIVKPSTQRRPPVCPYFGTCGGCQLQHLDYADQVDQKQHFVEDALVRIGKLQLAQPVDIVVASCFWAYRRHIRLTLFAKDESYRIGYVGVDGVELVEVSQCPIFINPEDEVVNHVAGLVRRLDFVGDLRAHLSIIKDGEGHYVLLVDFPGPVPVNTESVLQVAVAEEGSIVGAVWRAGNRGGSYGKTLCRFAIGDLNMTYSPMAFVQCHPEQSEHIYHQIEALTQECKARKVLDLYCGIGVTSLLLAKKGVAVVGVEGNPDAVLLARQNAQNNGCEGVVFERADVSKVTKKILRQGFDLVILNPPRTGVDAQTLEAIAHAAPKHLIYVSCMPATLARDLAFLCGKGYHVSAVRAYDMFPQTTHVETVTLLER